MFHLTIDIIFDFTEEEDNCDTYLESLPNTTVVT